MDIKRCYGCMRPIGNAPVCPHCGYDTRNSGAPHQLPPGTVLQNRYLLGKVLGQGGFGITYMGYDQTLGIPVAVKEYYPSGLVMRECSHSLSVTNCEGATGSLFAGNRDRFLREARSLAQLSHVPEVVQVRDFFQENNTAYIVMEFLAGQTLKSYVRNRTAPLTLRETVAVLLPVFRGLGRVHEAGLVHRDISPDNIMLTSDKTVKLLDFGAVRDVGAADVDKELTKSTEAILKQGFAPLEQYQKKGSLGPWTDVYALCATIYYCLTKTTPPDAPGLLLEESEIPWQELPGLTVDQAAVLAQGTAILPKNRIRSVSELAARLNEVLQDGEVYTAPVKTSGKTVPVGGTGAVTAPVRETEHKGAEKKTSGIPPMAVAAVVVIAAAAFLLGRGFGSDAPDVPIISEPTEIAVESTIAAVSPVPQTQPPETTEATERSQGTAQPWSEPEAAEEPTYYSGMPVTELDLIKDSDENNNGKELAVGRFRDAFGEYHDDSIRFMVINNKEYRRVAYVEYRLGGTYTELKGIALPGVDCDSQAVMTVEVWMDGKKIYKSDDITRDRGEAFSLDITGGKVLTIQCLTSQNKFGYCIVDAGVR